LGATSQKIREDKQMTDLTANTSFSQGSPNSSLVASAVAKNTWRLVPLLGLAYLFNYLDRTSVGFAALQMNKDIGLSATQFGWGRNPVLQLLPTGSP
jgi:ACS family tartrate transporter-like MFS transporter